MRSRAVIAAPPWLCGAQARTEIQLAVGEPFDDQHDAGAGWTAQAGWLGRIDAGGRAEQNAATFERNTSSTVGEESEVSDANHALGQNVDEETSQELMGGNGHYLLLAAAGIVSPAERDAIVCEGHEAMVGDGDAVSVAGQVVENMFGTAERRLGIDHPVLLAELPEEVAESARCGKRLERAMELESVLLEQFTKPQPEPAAEAAAECLDGQEEAGRGIDPSGAIESEAARRNDVVDMGMMLEVLSPGMEHAEESDVGSQVPGTPSQFEHRRCTGAVEQVVEQPLVLQDKTGEFMGQREHDVEVGHGQQCSRTSGQPLGTRVPLALRTVPVAA